MNLIQKQIFGNKKTDQVNTWIGGVSSTISTASILATKLGISVSRISNFTIVGSDIKCKITGSYSIPATAFQFNITPCTYYRDTDYLVTSIGFNSFYYTTNAGVNFGDIDFQNVTSVDYAGLASTKALKILLKNCTSVGDRAFFHHNTIYNKEFIYIPNCTTLGATTGDNEVFGGTYGVGSIIYCHPSLATNNGGNPDGDIAYAISQGAIVRYVTNFTAPNPVTTLSAGTVYNTAIQLNFTAPTGSTNAIDYYELYINGIFNKNITESGQYIIGLTPSTSYIFTLIAVDIFYNKSVASNSLSVTTTNDIALDYDSNMYINASGNSAYKSAIDDLYFGLKTQSLYSKIQAFYPFLGTTQAQHKWNGKNPLDTNAAFRLQFFGGGTHSNLGYQCNGTNAYADTNFIPRTFLSPTNCGTTVACGTNNTTATTDVQELGCQTSGSDILRQSVKSDNTGFTRQAYISGHNVYTSGVNEARGVFTQSKTSNSLLKSYRNGIILGQVTTTVAGTVPNNNLWIGAANGNGRFSNQRIQFTAIHEGLSDAEVATLHTIIDNFESAIGRKTW